MRGVLLVFHGNQGGENDRQKSLAELASGSMGVPVRCAYRRYSERRVRAVMEEMCDEGFDDITLVPMFVSENMYTSSIPRTFGCDSPEGAWEHGGRTVHYRITPAVGDLPDSPRVLADMVPADCSAVILAGKCGGDEAPALMSGAASILESRGIRAACCANVSDIADPAPRCDGRVAALPVSFGAGIRFHTSAEHLEPFGEHPSVISLIAAAVGDP